MAKLTGDDAHAILTAIGDLANKLERQPTGHRMTDSAETMRARLKFSALRDEVAREIREIVKHYVEETE